MNQEQGMAYVPFVCLWQDENRRPNIEFVGTVGRTISVPREIGFHSVREQDAYEQGQLSLATLPLPQAPESPDDLPEYSDYEKAAELIQEVLRHEMLIAGFASIQRAEPKELSLVLYLLDASLNESVPRTESAHPTSGVPRGIQEKADRNGIQIRACPISSAEFQLLDGLVDRISRICMTSPTVALFTRIPGKDEGLESGPRKWLRENGASGVKLGVVIVPHQVNK